MNKTDTPKFKRGQRVEYTPRVGTYPYIGEVTCVRYGGVYVRFPDALRPKDFFTPDHANMYLRIIE